MKTLFGIIIGLAIFSASSRVVMAEGTTWWQFQAIDTMKYSRDLAEQTLDNPAAFSDKISFQVKAIAETGATHVSIATPYDPEYLPVLRMWVAAARKNNLNVWFRGNFAGWEGWFEYDRIDEDDHKEMLEEFLNTNTDLFEEGDIFSSCPECENGGPGDPRMTRKIDEYRAFLIDEYTISKTAFFRMGKNVTPNLHSMNADVAKLIMDENTTRSVGGYVVIDHYVKDPSMLVDDVRIISAQSKGKIIFGEMGAPIPDIHGAMTEQEQARWIDQALSALSLEKAVVGINYWVGTGGSTQIWNDGGSPRAAVDVIRRYYKPAAAKGIVYGRDNTPLAEVTVKTPWRMTMTDKDGAFVLPLAAGDSEISVFAVGYHSQNLAVSSLGISDMDIRLEKEEYSIFDRIKLFFLRIFG